MGCGGGQHVVAGFAGRCLCGQYEIRVDWADIRLVGYSSGTSNIRFGAREPDGLPVEHVDVLLDLARRGREQEFRDLAAMLGVDKGCLDALWTGTRQRLGLDGQVGAPASEARSAEATQGPDGVRP